MPEEKTKPIALIGGGMVAPTIAAALHDAPGVHLDGVLTRSDLSAKAFVDEHAPDAKVLRSLQELIKAKPTFAILATPPDARSGAINALATAGIPVLTEKPIERSLSSAAGLVKRMEAAALPFGVMFQHRMRPAVRDLKGLSPGLGRLRAVEISVPWWRDQSYYDAPGRGTYARDGGGVMISQAIHTLDLALQFTGPARSVTAFTATTGFHKMEAEDFVAAGFEFGEGVVGSFTASTAAFPGRAETISLHYDEASALLEGNLLKLNYRDGRIETYGDTATTGAGADPMAFSHAWHQAVIEDFSDAISTGRDPAVTAKSGLEVHRLIDAMERSAASGKRESVG